MTHKIPLTSLGMDCKNKPNPSYASHIDGYNTRTLENAKSVLEIDEEKLAMELHAEERKEFGFGYQWENERIIRKNQYRNLAKHLSQKASFFMKITKQ